jgi:hypothetical protein
MPFEERGVIPIRMEEEEDTDDGGRRRPGFGFAAGASAAGSAAQPPPGEARAAEFVQESLKLLLDERHTIISDAKLSTKEKVALLESNRKSMVILGGGSIRKTENVIYAVLIFNVIVIALLAALTAYSTLPKEVTLTFVGTVVGGTISLIAQKLGVVDSARRRRD